MESKYYLAIRTRGDSLSGFYAEHYLGQCYNGNPEQYFWMADKKHGKTFTKPEILELEKLPIIQIGRQRALYGKLTLIPAEVAQ